MVGNRDRQQPRVTTSCWQEYAMEMFLWVSKGGVGNLPNSDESGSRRGVATSLETPFRADS